MGNNNDNIECIRRTDKRRQGNFKYKKVLNVLNKDIQHRGTVCSTIYTHYHQWERESTDIK